MSDGGNVKIITIQVNTESFDAFITSFNAFEARLKNTVAEWGKLNAAIATSAASLQTAAIKSATIVADAQKQAEKDADKAAQKAAKSQQKAEKEALDAAKAVANAKKLADKETAKSQQKAEKEALDAAKAVAAAQKKATLQAKADALELQRASDMAFMESMRTRSAVGYIDSVTDAVNAKEAANRDKGIITRVKENPMVQDIMKFVKTMKKAAKMVGTFTHALFSVVSTIGGVLSEIVTKIAKIGLGFAVGSLVGISKLVNSLVSEHRESVSAGLTLGERRALGVDFKEFISDPESFAQSMVDLRTSPSKAATLAALGIEHDAALKMGQADFDILVIRKLHDLYQKNLKAFPKLVDSSDLWNALRITDVIGIDTIRNVGKVPDKELADRVKRFQTDRQTMDIPDVQFHKNAELARQMNDAERSFSAGFMNALADSAGGINKVVIALTGLGTAAGKLAKALIPSINTGLDAMARGITTLSKALDGKATSGAMQSFFDVIKQSGNLIAAVFGVIKDALTNLMPSVMKYSSMAIGTAGWGYEKIDAWIKHLTLPSADANNAELTKTAAKRAEHITQHHHVRTTDTRHSSTSRPVTDVRIVVSNLTGSNVNAVFNSLASAGYA